MKVNYSFVAPQVYEETRQETEQSKRVDKPLSFVCYEEATVVVASRFLDAGVLDREGKTIPEGAFAEFRTVQSPTEGVDIQHSDETVIYLGILHNVWGHCLTDALKKIWFLHTEACQKLLAEGAKLVYLLPNQEELRPYALQLYMLAGVDLSQMTPVQKTTRFRRVIVPDNSLMGAVSKFGQWKYTFTSEYVAVLETIRQQLAKTEIAEGETYRKIYLTRTGLDTQGREYGENEIERVFRRLGFQVIAPEKYTLEQQYYLLSHCEELAVTEGSISHSALFCRPGTKLILLRKSYYVNGYQSVINEVADLDVTYIDVHRSLPQMQYAAMYGPFYLCITPELERFVGHKIPHWPLWMRPSWWWFCNRNRKIVHKISSLCNLSR